MSVVAEPSLRGRSLVRISDWSRAELEAVLDLAVELKAGPRRSLLPGRSLGMIFHKPSTRTRVSFEVGMEQLGGHALNLAAADLQLARGEGLRETAIVLSGYLDAILIRTFAEADVDELARHASVPVINGLTDATHPCQALADALTIRERLGGTDGVRVAYVGDGNNVLHSLAAVANRLGMSLVAATPPGFEPDAAEAERAGGIVLTHNPIEAVRGADVVYTDVWTSMGQEAEHERRRRAFRGYGVDERMLARAAPGAIAMHCLPAHLGEEITEGVAYGTQSAIWQQAENRLHAQKALLALVVA
ncbi:MAG: ornithine carbamoyltransferase [Pseudomonadota bacterium]